MQVTARLRRVSATQWGTRKFMNMELLKELDREIKREFDGLEAFVYYGETAKGDGAQDRRETAAPEPPLSICLLDKWHGRRTNQGHQKILSVLVR
jgi:hypothetical protein